MSPIPFRSPHCSIFTSTLIVILLSSFAQAQSWTSGLSPAPFSNNALRSTDIRITFNRDISAASVQNDGFRVFGSQSGFHAGSVSYDSVNRTAIFDPTESFRTSERVFVTVRRSIVSAAGDTIPAPVAWEFSPRSEKASGVLIPSKMLMQRPPATARVSADVNGDGRTDIVLTTDDSLFAWTSMADSSFSRTTSIPLPGSPLCVAAGDLDADGDVDLLAGRRNAVIATWLNDGTGSWTPGDSVPVVGALSIALADFDGDGRLDLAAAVRNSSSTQVHRGEGNGSFAAAGTVSNLAINLHVLAADVTRDGRTDIVQVSSSYMSISTNTGGFTFSTANSGFFNLTPTEVFPADFDKNGRVDFVAYQKGHYEVQTERGSTFGFFEGPYSFNPGMTINGVATIDATGDGSLDLYIAGSQGGTPHIVELTNIGNIQWQKRTPIPFPDSQGPLLSGDFNGDGRTDLLIERGAGDLHVLLNGTPYPILEARPEELAFGTVSLDSSGVLGLKIINRGTSPLNLTGVQAADPAFDATVPASTIAEGDSVTISVTFHPTEFREHLDSLIIESNDPARTRVAIPLRGSVSIIRSLSPRPWTLDAPDSADISITYALPLDPASVHDSAVTVAGSMRGRYAGTILYEAASSTVRFAPSQNFFPGEVVNVVVRGGLRTGAGDTPKPFQWEFVAAPGGGSGQFLNVVSKLAQVDLFDEIQATDLDHDGDADLIGMNYSSGYLTVQRNNGDLTFTLQNSPVIGYGAGAFALGDLDADGRTDVVVLLRSQSLVVLRQQPDGSMVPRTPIPIGGYSYGLALGDIDLDGLPDLVLRGNWPFMGARVWKNTGDLGFLPADSIAMVEGPSIVDLADLDDDGDLDLVTGLGGTLSFYERTVGFTFQPRGSAASNRPNRLTFADLDGDNDADIAMMSQGSVTFLRNDGRFRFVAPAGANYFGYSYYWSNGDFDGDGDLDLVTSAGESGYRYFENQGGFVFAPTWRTLGRMTYYQVASADLDNDGDIDLAFRPSYEGGYVLALNRGREPSLRALTAIHDFHVVRIDSSKQSGLSIVNDGTQDVLVVDSIRTSHPAFTVIPASASVDPGDTLRLTVRFSPTEPRLYRDSLALYSNDPKRSLVWIRLTGEGDQITSISPQPYSARLSDRSVIEGDWAFALNPATVTDSTVVVTGTSSGRRIDIDVTYNADAHRVTITPVGTYPKGEKILVNFTSGVQSGDGQPAFRPRQWEYTIQAAHSSAYFRPKASVLLPTDPLSVTPGDFDGDGDLDLAVVVAGGAKLVVLRTDSAWHLTPVFEAADLFGPAQILAGDYDGDGKVDIVATGAASTLQFFRNDGAFQFTRKDLATPGYIQLVTQGDYDGDGDIDFGCASTSSGGEFNIVRNDGKFTFTVFSESRSSYISGLSSGDYDGDGDIDIAVPFGTTNIFRNDSGFSFTKLGGLEGAYPKDEADLDEDGDLDVLSGGYPNAAQVYNNLGDLRFEAFNLSYAYAQAMHAADLNGDGRLDVVMADGGGTHAYFNTGAMSFRAGPSIVDAAPPYGFAVCDLDGDGDRDIATVSIATEELTLYENRPEFSAIVLSRTGHHFGTVAIDSGGRTSFRILNKGSIPLVVDSMTVADSAFTVPEGPVTVASNDSVTIDVWFQPKKYRSYSDSVLIYSNDPERPVVSFAVLGRVFQRIAESVYPPSHAPSAAPDSVRIRLAKPAVAASLDTVRLTVTGSSSGPHGRTFTYDPGTHTIVVRPTGRFTAGEVVTVTLGSNFLFEDGAPVYSSFATSFTVRATQGIATFGKITMFMAASPEAICTADLDTNGMADIAFTTSLSSRLYLIRSRGPFLYDQLPAITVPYPPIEIRPGDMDGDGRMDLVLRTSQDVSVYRNNGSFTFTRTSVPALANPSASLAVADLDGDGDQDMVTAGFTDQAVRLHFNTGGLHFEPIDLFIGATEPRQIETGDIDNDGDVDVILGKGSGANIVLLVNEGERNFRAVPLPAVTSYARTIWNADYDADGRLDIAIGHSNVNSMLVLKNRGDLTFQTVFQPGVTYDPLFLVGGDYDSDGDIDLISSNNGYYPSLSIYRNDSSAFAAMGNLQVAPGSYPMAAGDVDGNGSVDVAFCDMSSQALVILQNQKFIPYSLNYDSLDFGAVEVGSSKERWLDVLNVSDHPISIDSIVTGSSMFQAAVNKTTLVPGDTAHITVTFAPTQEGWFGIILAIFVHGEDPVGRNMTGTGTIPLSVERIGGEVPTEYALEQNYPNPFNPTTVIRFAIPQASHVRLSVYDIRGREVMPAVERECEPGWFTLTFNAEQLVSGVYLYRLNAVSAGPGPARAFVKTQKMVMVR